VRSKSKSSTRLRYCTGVDDAQVRLDAQRPEILDVIPIPVRPIRVRPLPSHPQGDFTFFREFAGIAQQVEQNLLEPHGIRIEYAHVLLRFDDEAVLILLGELSGGALFS
jgi:hypothetical protein